ncbi:MAG: helix-hairpin-helix domain-containing protein [Ardenticatenaceae bacterium]|nr:helix-hairpin-helix domain-containing protein [Anaerolineales bacterium]MCB8922517.1 helix-hairpin-helix domain-containing protein [Ardenticatenaceae bacterium]MCB8989986.1 helix-hairpin-helix domain-containing protein [Ardenticatenaceae bacterium]
MNDTAIIDINHADEATLAALLGIGEALAARIIEYRETVHPFDEVIELTAVPGISERMVRQFADRLTVSVVEGADDDMDDRQDDEGTAVPAIEPIEPETAVPAEPAVEAEPAEPAVEDTQDEDDTPEVEPIILRETEPAAPEPVLPTLPAAADGKAPPSQRRGCVLITLGALVGALLGMALTLGALLTLNNGTLRFAEENSRLRGEVSVLQQRETELGAQVVTMQAQAGDAGRVLATAVPMLQAVATQQAAAQVDLDTLGGDVDDLQETAVTLEERMGTVLAAAEDFDAFLTGLRDLLFELEGTPPITTPLTTTQTITPTATPASADTQTGSTAVPTPTPVVTHTPTPLPTRTPRPTATPIGTP